MAVTATGALANTMQKLEDLVANSSTFQTAVGAATAAAAKEFIHYPFYLVDKVDFRRPFSVIERPEGQGLIYDGDVRLNKNNKSGSLVLALYKPNTGLNIKDDSDTQSNYAEAVLDDIADAEGIDDALPIEDMETGGPQLVKFEEQATVGDFWATFVTVNWNSLAS